MRYRAALLIALAMMVAGIATMMWPKSAATAHSGIESIHFDTARWRHSDTSLFSLTKIWKSDAGDLLELKWVSEFPHLGDEGDVESLRAESHHLATGMGGSLVHAEVITVASRTANMLIYKRGRFSGDEYVGMLFVRNAADHFVFTMVSKESGENQARETRAGAEARVRAALRSLQQTIAFQ